MKPHHSFRPSVMILESRWLPTAAAYPDIFQNDIQQSFVAQADQKTNEVVFLGDSITYNWGTSTRSAPGSAAFTADFAELGAANFGIIGDTTQNLLYRVEDGDLNGQPKVAVVMIGFNDLFGGSTPAQTASGVTSVIQSIQAASPETKVLLLGVLPSKVTALNPEIQRVDALISVLGNDPGVTYLNPGALFGGTNGAANPSLLMDLVHPDAEGYQILAKAIDGTILNLLDGVVVPTSTALSAASKNPASETILSQSALLTSSASSPVELIPLDSGLDNSPFNVIAAATDRPKSFATELVDVSTGSSRLS